MTAKALRVPLAEGVVEANKIRSLFADFLGDEFELDFVADHVDVHLGALDYTAFQNVANRLLVNGALHEDSKKVVRSILAAITSVKSYGLQNGKRVYTDYNAERKVQHRKAKEAKRQPFYYARGHSFSKAVNALPSNYENAIICGDAKKTLEQLPDNCVDIVLTSPPYNFGLDYAMTADDAKWETYFEQLFAIFAECIRVLKYGGRAIINVQPLFSDYIPTHHIISRFFLDKKMLWKGEILWEKHNYNCKYTAWGSWKSPSNPYLKYTWEFLEIFCKGDLKKAGRADDADITADEFKKWVVGKWAIAPERNMQQYGHPAMFPEELVVRALSCSPSKTTSY